MKPPKTFNDLMITEYMELLQKLYGTNYPKIMHIGKWIEIMEKIR